MHFLEWKCLNFDWDFTYRKFVPKGPINNISALVQIMAWHKLGDKPLSEPMMVSWLTHVCVTWPQWGKATTSKQIYIIFSCDQAALQMVFSVCLSVCPSVRPSVCPSHLFDYVPIIVSSWNFQELLPVTEVTSMQKVKVRDQRSRSQRSQPNFTVSGL